MRLDIFRHITALLGVICITAINLSAQTSVGINVVGQPNPNAVLELSTPSGNQGFLVPRISEEQRLNPEFVNSLSAKENGLVVFDTTSTMFYFWSDSVWIKGLGGGDVSYEEFNEFYRSFGDTITYITDILELYDQYFQDIDNHFLDIENTINDTSLYFNTRISELEQTFYDSLVEIENEFIDVHNDIDNLTIELDSIENIFNDTALYFNTRIDNINQTLNDTALYFNTRIDDIDQTINDTALYFNTRIDSINQYFSDTTQYYNTQIGNIYDSITLINSTVSNLDNRVTNLEGDVITLQGDLVSLEGDVLNLGDNVSIINDSVLSYSNHFNLLDSTVSNLYDSIANIQNTINNLILGSLSLDQILMRGNNAGDYTIAGLGAPQNPRDAVTKQYVDDTVLYLESEVTRLDDSIADIYSQLALDLDKDFENEAQQIGFSTVGNNIEISLTDVGSITGGTFALKGGTNIALSTDGDTIVIDGPAHQTISYDANLNVLSTSESSNPGNPISDVDLSELDEVGTLPSNAIARWDGSLFQPTTMWSNGDSVVVGAQSAPSSYSYNFEVVGTFKTEKIYHSSDKRWKKNIETVDSALAKIEALRGVTYEWRTDEFENKHFSQGTQLGLIAQEVEAVVPEIVSTGDDGYKAVEYANLVALLIEAVKEQQQIINRQNEKIASLEEETNSVINLKAENKQIESQLEQMQKQINAMAEVLQMTSPTAQK